MLSLPYSSGISYKERLMKTGLLPLCYWHEYLDMVYLFKKIVSADHPNIQIKAIRRVTRHNSQVGEITISIPRFNSLTFQNSFYCRTPRVFNRLPSNLRQHTISIGEFKNNLFKYYSQMTQEIYNIDVPQTFKTICVKCHSCRLLSSLSVKMCCH